MLCRSLCYAFVAMMVASIVITAYHVYTLLVTRSQQLESDSHNSSPPVVSSAQSAMFTGVVPRRHAIRLLPRDLSVMPTETIRATNIFTITELPGQSTEPAATCLSTLFDLGMAHCIPASPDQSCLFVVPHEPQF